MNAQVRLSTFDFPHIMSHLSRASIGFDELFDRLAQSAGNLTNYPPHNLIRNSETSYTIEVAVAGFSESELDVNVEANMLTISGSKTGDAPEYLYQGISNKDFSKTISLAEHVVVREAIYKDGLLSINLEIVVPEELKPRKIGINQSPKLGVDKA